MGNILRKITNICPWKKKKRPENRRVLVGNKPPPHLDSYVPEKYPSNRIISSHYTAWNFLPMNLFEQFHRIANFYFLVMAIIAIFIDTPVSPWTSILPLIFVVVVTAVKQGYEDWLRHKADKEVNFREAHVIRDGKLQTIKAMDIHVGDIVQVKSNEGLPCDVVMLSSYDREGECYITTANLDGETNLKTFYCVSETRHLQTDESFESFRATIDCQQPITDLYKFIGVINLYNNNNETTPENATIKSLSAENVLLRGARVKNTPFIYGCAIYTGQETKISLNSMYKSHKYSTVERRMNTFLIIFLIALIVYSAIWTGLQVAFYREPSHQTNVMWYATPDTDVTALSVIEDFLAFMVLCNYVIPISMYVTVELQKFFGSIFFEWDIEMYDAQSDESAKANTSDLNEELGQVEYLFTDKTGTLTENDMQFRQCSVKGVKYEEVGGQLCVKPDIPGVQATPIASIPEDVQELLTVLAVCHTVRVDRSARADSDVASAPSVDVFEYEYQASSPDEKALVEACRRFGMVYHGVRNEKVEVTFKGEMHRYHPRHVLDFDPTRKRMSVIVEDESGSKWLMCKGAESALFDRVAEGDVETAERHVDDYAMLGLRTLVAANKLLTEEEFANFNNLLRDARNSLEDRDQKLAEAYNVVENNFKLVGVTAVEDKLQDGVFDTISSLREAGIKVWVLTGDKEETAVNISYSAGHFVQGMIEMRLTRQKTMEECVENLKHISKVVDNATALGERRHALIVDGPSLAIAMKSDVELFGHVCQSVVTVLCCRMSPIQKAMVVKLVKNSKSKPVTAAVGDGANDVSMIQEANVGLGIMGKEGRAAVRSSDYAFGRFRFLKRALLVHGHFFYVRIAVLVQYFFYKNVAMITAQLYYTFFSAMSAQSVYDSFFLTLYNMVFSSMPILLYGVLEQHTTKDLLLNRPRFYRTIKRNARLSNWQFLKWNALGLWHSLVCFFGPYFCMFSPETMPAHSGQMLGVYEFGSIVMTTCVWIVNIKLMLETYHWNGLIFFGFALTFVGYYALTFIYSSVIWEVFMTEYNFYGGFAKVCGSPYVWFSLIFLCVLALLPDLLLRGCTDMFSDMYRQQRTARVGPKMMDSDSPPSTFSSSLRPVAAAVTERTLLLSSSQSTSYSTFSDVRYVFPARTPRCRPQRLYQEIRPT